MNLVKTVKQFARKAMDTISLRSHDSNLLFRLIGQDYRYGTQSKDFLLDAYGMNPYVYMVIDRITQRFIQIDKKILDRVGQELESPDARFTELLKNPNNKEDFNQYLYRAGGTFLATGEVFIVRKQELGETDQYFIPINYNVTINETTEGEIISYWVNHFGQAKTYLPNEVLHISKPDITFDTNRGFSTLRATRRVWESNNEVWNSEVAIHQNKGITGVLYSDGNRPMTPTEQTELQKKYDGDYTGVNNFGKVKVSSSKLGYIQMGMNPNDLKSIETRLDHLRTICAAYNVDSKLFGDAAASTYNNMAEAQRAFILNAVLPLSKLLLPEIIGFMSRSIFVNYSMVLNEDSILELQLSKEQKSARLGREVVQGILTAEQAREILYPELVEALEDEEPTPTPEETTTRESVSIDEILRLQENIINETITRDNAVAMLVALYGFDEQTAEEILG